MNHNSLDGTFNLGDHERGGVWWPCTSLASRSGGDPLGSLAKGSEVGLGPLNGPFLGHEQPLPPLTMGKNPTDDRTMTLQTPPELGRRLEV